MLPRVEHLPPSEWQRAGEVEGPAFADTPLFRALFPDPDSRAEISSVVMAAGIRLAPAGRKIVETAPSRAARDATMYAKLGFELTENGHGDVLDIPVWRMIHRTSRTGPPSTPPNNAEPATATRSGG